MFGGHGHAMRLPPPRSLSSALTHQFNGEDPNHRCVADMVSTVSTTSIDDIRVEVASLLV